MDTTLRDLMAASALQGIAARPRSVGPTDLVAMGREAYALADAALEARDNPQDTRPAQRALAQQRPTPVRAVPSSVKPEPKVGAPPPSFQGFVEPPQPK